MSVPPTASARSIRCECNHDQAVGQLRSIYRVHHLLNAQNDCMLLLRIHEVVLHDLSLLFFSGITGGSGRVGSTHRVYRLLDAQDVAVLQLRVQERVLHALLLAHDSGLVLDLLVHVQLSVFGQPSPVLEQRRERPVGDARWRDDVANVLQARQTSFQQTPLPIDLDSSGSPAEFSCRGVSARQVTPAGAMMWPTYCMQQCDTFSDDLLICKADVQCCKRVWEGESCGDPERHNIHKVLFSAPG